MSIKHAFAAAAIAAVAIPSTANASVTVNINQVGSDVVATATGTLNLAGLVSQGSSFFLSEAIRPSVAFVGLGAAGSITGYSGLTGPSTFGLGGITDSSSFTGTSFALNGSSFGSPYVFVPEGYVSGASISGNATWLGQTLASLGATPGTYVYTSNNDSVTINIGGGAVPEPASWAMMLFGFGAIGFVMRRGRKSTPQTA